MFVSRDAQGECPTPLSTALKRDFFSHQRRVNQSHEDFEKEPIKKEVRKQSPFDLPQETHEGNHGQRVNELGWDGAQIVAQPKLFSVGLGFPIMEQFDVQKLGN